jgi:hypothetical protein
MTIVKIVHIASLYKSLHTPAVIGDRVFRIPQHRTSPPVHVTYKRNGEQWRSLKVVIGIKGQLHCPCNSSTNLLAFQVAYLHLGPSNKPGPIPQKWWGNLDRAQPDESQETGGIFYRLH